MDPISSTATQGHAAQAAPAQGCAIGVVGVGGGMDQLSTSAEPVTSQEWGASADGLWALEADSTSALGLMPILPSPRLNATAVVPRPAGQQEQGQGPLTLGRLDLAAASQQQKQQQQQRAAEAAARAHASLQQQQAEAQALLRQLGVVTASSSSSSSTPAPQQQQPPQSHAAPASSASSVCSTSGGQQLGVVGPDGKRRGSDTARKDRSNILKAYLMNVGCTKVRQIGWCGILGC